MSRRRSRHAPIAWRVEALESRVLLDAGPSAEPASSLLVRFAPGASEVATDRLLDALGGRVVSTFPDGTELVALAGPSSRDAALVRLRADPLVVDVEPNATLSVGALMPDDPSFAQQWGLNGLNDVDINAPEAWDLVDAGGAPTVVAVLDTGIDITHPDLVGQLWHNPVDGSLGWNFVDGTTDVRDDNGHGTHVSGIIAASGDNGVGVAGVDWNARIMVLKVIDRGGTGSLDAAVSAVYYAAQHGARVINASWTSPVRSRALAEAIRYAGSLGAVFVAAAGNDASDIDAFPTYPASEAATTLISVAAVDRSGAPASFSNRGTTSVDLAAPGVGILSTIPGGYGYLSGTSMAAPFVTGVVALMIGNHPGLGAEQVVQRILASARTRPGLAGTTRTGGLLDAARALAIGGIGVASLARGYSGATLVLQRPSTGHWFALDLARNASTGVDFGGPGLDVAVPADYDGDGRSDIAVFRPSTATWYILGSRGIPWSVSFGGSEIDVPVPADYDGDGRSDLAAFQLDTATWTILRSRSGGLVVQPFGGPGLDVPVAAPIASRFRSRSAAPAPISTLANASTATAAPSIAEAREPDLAGSPASTPAGPAWFGRRGVRRMAWMGRIGLQARWRA